MRQQTCLFLVFAWCYVVPSSSASTPSDGNETIAESILARGVEEGVFPGAVGAVGSDKGVLSTTTVGRFTNDVSSNAMTLTTIFDIASLTKVIATTTAVAILYQEGHLDLDTPVTSILGDEFGTPNNGTKAAVTVRHCLTHTAGFPPDPDPWYWNSSFGCPDPEGEPPVPPAAPLAEDFRCVPMVYASLLAQPLSTIPGEKFLYSDLSFITLQFVVGKLVYDHGLVAISDDLSPVCLAARLDSQHNLGKSVREGGGAADGNNNSDVNPSNEENMATLYTCSFEAFVRTRLLAPLMPASSFLPDPASWAQTAPTLNDSLYTGGQPLQGQVSDGDAYAMGGIAGHAGLFSTLADVAAFASALLSVVRGEDDVAAVTPSTSSSSSSLPRTRPFPLNATTARLFTTVANVSMSSRALGWDTNLHNVSDYGFGGVCGAHASKHAFLHIGYTGTCLCIDPEGSSSGLSDTPLVSTGRNNNSDMRGSGGGFFSVLLTNRVFACQGQLCPSGSEDAVKRVYFKFNTAVSSDHKQGNYLEQSP